MAAQRQPRRSGRGARSLLGAACCAAAGVLAAGQDGLPEPGKPFTTTLSGDGGPVIGLTPLGSPGTSTLTLNLLSDVDADAVCNDGSPGGYFMAPGSGAGANTWLVYLEGSMFCWDESSCNERYADHQYWMSSTGWATSMAQGGIFNPDGPSAWGDANRIYLKYCSSDFWSGDVAASPDTFNYAFRGARIVAATITDLLNKQGMGSTPGARLLFSGCSAGAIGAMNNLESVAAQLPPTVTLHGMLDAAALLDIAPTGWAWSPLLEPLQSLIAKVVAFINPVFPAACTDAFPGETWKCLIGQYRMPMITSVPFFVNAPQFDEFELMYDTDNFAPATPEQFAFAESFQTGTLALIASLPPGTGVFSPTCLVHCLSGQIIFSDLQVDGTNMADALSNWYFNGAPTSVVSSCTGWDCINACGIIIAGYPNAGLPCNTGSSGCVPVELATDAAGVVVEPPPTPKSAAFYGFGDGSSGGSSGGKAEWVSSSPHSRDSAPAEVADVEASLTTSQQAAMAQIQQQSSQTLLDLESVTKPEGGGLTTFRRLMSAAPACCNGRANE